MLAAGDGWAETLAFYELLGAGLGLALIAGLALGVAAIALCVLRPGSPADPASGARRFR